MLQNLKVDTSISENLFQKTATKNKKKPERIRLQFIDSHWYSQKSKPSLEYYRHLYKTAGFSADMIESLITGLSRTSLYEGPTSR